MGSGESVLRFSRCTVSILPTAPSPQSQTLLLMLSRQSALLCDSGDLPRSLLPEIEQDSRLWPPGLSKVNLILKWLPHYNILGYLSLQPQSISPTPLPINTDAFQYSVIDSRSHTLLRRQAFLRISYLPVHKVFQHGRTP